jgi:chromosome segregation ATPase
MRAESAEIKVASESKLDEGRNMVVDAHKKFIEAEAKLHAAESLEAEASRCHHAAERKLQEVEAREDDLRRRIVSFKSEYVSYSFISYSFHNYFSKLHVFKWDLVSFNYFSKQP